MREGKESRQNETETEGGSKADLAGVNAKGLNYLF